IPEEWKNPSGDWHLGTKPLYELYSKVVKDRINSSKKEELQKKNKSAIAEALKEFNEHEKKFGTKTKKIWDKENREEINAKLEYLKEAEKQEIESPILDCIVWFDGEKWKACITLNEDLEAAKILSSFCIDKEYGFLSDNCLVSYCFNISEDGNLLEICVPNGSHGSHVAHIAAAHFPDDPEKDGLAPGAQIISLCLGNAYTEQAFIRAFNKCIELKVDIINLSCDTPQNCVDSGKTVKLIQSVVEKYGIIFVAAVGNDGPGLSVAGFAGGRIHSCIFYVGAYLTAEMKEAMYSHFEADNSVVFPFSSRGPCADGSLGVTFCAPGAALTGVSKHELEGTQRKHGTSMSSPNAAGNIACLLSAMKAESIPISPFRIKLALQNSAMIPEDGIEHPFSLGAGIIQICDAFKMLKSGATNFIPTTITDFKINVGANKRGIYLREPYEIAAPYEVLMDVKPTFTDSGDNDSRLHFGCPITLKLSHGSKGNFVKFPKYSRLPSSDFSVHVDPTNLEAGKAHYAEIIGTNPKHPSLGPLFRIPITVIIPEKLIQDDEFCYKKKLTLEPAIPQRLFIQSPFGCNYVAIKVKSLEKQNFQRLRVQRIFLEQKNRCRIGNSQIQLPPKSVNFCHFVCPENQTIEFCFSQDSYSQEFTNIKITIKFYGMNVHPTTLFSVNPTNKINVTNYLNETTIEPVLEFNSFCQPLSPSEAIIESMNERDIIDGNPSFKLLLTYKFYAKKSELYKFNHEGTDHYNKYFDCYLLQVFTVSKKHIFTCGDYGKLQRLQIGDYIIRVQFRHSDPTILEKLKDARLIVSQTFIQELVADIYSDAESALKESGEKMKKKILDSGETASLFVASVPSYKYPYPYPIGSYLKGRLSLHSNETYKSKEHSNCDFIYLLAPPKSYLNVTNGRLDLEADKVNEKEDLKTNSLLDEFLQVTTKDIPNAFRNGFDPKKENSDAKIDDSEKVILQNDEEEKLNEKGLNLTSKLANENFKETSKMEKAAEAKVSEKTVHCQSESSSISLSSCDESVEKVETDETDSKKKLKTAVSKKDSDNSAAKPDEKISINSESLEISLEEVEKAFRDYMLFADSTSENAQIIQAKYAVAHERFGTALMQLKKIMADKTTTSDYLSTEKAIIQKQGTAATVKTFSILAYAVTDL
uniref:Tripeptidyl-peptidase 2 n=1 Tax=Panagrolaimus sp. ES5 TaxID=591445 RepID=A0AC34GUP0_9BILA